LIEPNRPDALDFLTLVYPYCEVREEKNNTGRLMFYTVLLDKKDSRT